MRYALRIWCRARIRQDLTFSLRSVAYSLLNKTMPVAQNPTPENARFLILHEFPGPEIESLWRDFLRRVDYPAHYNMPEFFLEPYWAANAPLAVLAFMGSEMVGVLTALRSHKTLTSGLPSRPQVCIDPKAAPAEVTDILAEGLIAGAGKADLITVFSWQSTPLQGFERHGFRLRKANEVVVLDLSPGADAIFEKLAKNRRRDVRLAIRNGIDIAEETSEDDLRAYWEVYSAWRKTERKKIEHDRSFESIEKVHHMRGNHRRFLARYQGKVIAAAGFRFCPGGTIEYANNCSLDEYMKLLPNDLLVWRTIEWACQQGFKRYSFGGAHPFLRKWGGEVISIDRYRLDRSMFRRHDLREDVGATARKLMRRMPSGLQGRIKKILGKS